MANEISANNIKQSYDLAENKIFPKTTINGIVFDSDDSVVGSSAIVKSLVNEDLLVRNLEVNVDGSTGGYIHLKTNNGDESGVGVLELKLGHKTYDDKSTNKIYINDANDSNTDVSAFFNHVHVSSKEYVGKFDNATLKSGNMNVNLDEKGVVVNNGSVTAGTYYVGKGGNIGSSKEGLIELVSREIKASSIRSINFSDNTIELNSGDAGISIAGKMGIINMRDASSDGYISASLNKLDIMSNDIISLGTSNIVVHNGVGKPSVLTLSETTDITNCVKLIFDASKKDINLDLQIDYTDDVSSHIIYPIRYFHDVQGNESQLHLNAYNQDAVSSYLYVDADEIDASTYGILSLSSRGDCYLASDTSIHIVAPSITGTVNGVNEVLMGIPIGSVVKWPNVNKKIPEGWVSYETICKELLQLDYIGIVYTDNFGEERMCRCIDASTYSKDVSIYGKSSAFGYAVDVSKWDESFKYGAENYVLYAGRVNIDSSYRDVYHIFKFRNYAIYKGFYDNFECSVDASYTNCVDFPCNIYGGEPDTPFFKFNNDGSVYKYLDVFDVSRPNLLLFKIYDASSNAYNFRNVGFKFGEGDSSDILWNSKDSTRLAVNVLNTLKAQYGRKFYFSAGDIFKYK